MRVIGANIRSVRKIRGLTQEELAKKAKLSTMSVRRYENGDRIATEKVLANIADALDISSAYLLGWSSIVSRLDDVGLSIDDVADELNIPRDRLEHIANKNDVSSISSMLKIITVATILADETERKATEILNHIKDNLKSLSTPIERVTRDMAQMTQEGQKKVVDYVEDILPRYRTETAPQSPPVPQEGNSTTPPPEGAEGPQEGEWGVKFRPPDELPTNLGSAENQALLRTGEQKAPCPRMGTGH